MHNNKKQFYLSLKKDKDPVFRGSTLEYLLLTRLSQYEIKHKFCRNFMLKN